MKTTLYVLLATLTYTSSLTAQNTYRLTVNELFERGLQNSIAIQSSVIKTQISEDKVGLAKNKRLPDISVSGLFGYTGTLTILDKDLSFLKHSDCNSAHISGRADKEQHRESGIGKGDSSIVLTKG